MLRLHHSLMFPSLVRKGETSFKKFDSGTLQIYNLDWSHMDQKKAQKWVDWRARWNDIRTLDEYHGTLPEPYNEWVKGLQFAIPERYLEQIHQNARDAVVGWAKEYHFDTMIREVCLEPAIANTFVAFRLLADCIYDPETNYFDRSDEKIYAPQAMLYKFWIGQTGRGLIKDHAEWRRITWFLDENKKTPWPSNDSRTETIRKFIKAIEDFEEQYEKLYELHTDGENTGPSIEPETN